MERVILITGATGMIGKAVTYALLAKGYTIHHLTRQNTTNFNPHVKTFKWDVNTGYIDEKCINNVTAIIHLAGENIGARPWTRERRKALVESRTKSINLIYELLQKTPGHTVKTVVSASAVGFYGDRGDTLLTESSPAGSNILADITVQWEKAVDAGTLQNLRVVKLRSGIVLDKDEGAFRELSRPARAGLPSPLGSGKQWLPWIHINDAVNMYIFALENENMHGAYNMASPQVVTNQQFMHTLASVLHRTWFLPAVPAFTLRILLGKMSEMLLMSTKVSADKILEAGFRFQYNDLREALKDITGE